MPNGDPKVLQAIAIDASSACSEVRRKGVADADRILQSDPAHSERGERLAFINRVFDGVDQFSVSLVTMLVSLTPDSVPSAAKTPPSGGVPGQVPFTTRTASRSFPEALLRPVQAYSTCMADSRNAAMGRSGGISTAAEARAIEVQVKIDCRDQRAAAASEGDSILRMAGSRDERQRAAIVEDALLTVDEHGENLARMIERSNAPAARAARMARLPKGVLVPNAMADVFDKYVACFDENMDVTRIRQQSDLRKAVDRALAACKTRRADLIAESDTALTRDPAYRDPEKRAKAVAAAFDTEDEIKRAMGDGRVLYEGD
jgi:hypothetical protein